MKQPAEVFELHLKECRIKEIYKRQNIPSIVIHKVEDEDDNDSTTFEHGQDEENSKQNDNEETKKKSEESKDEP